MFIKKSPIFNFWHRRFMKWPSLVQFVRHDISEYNVLLAIKLADPLYQEFLAAYEADYTSAKCRDLAEQIRQKYSLPYSDQETPVVQVNSDRVVNTARNLARIGNLPDVIFVSPSRRTKQTLGGLMVGWPALRNVRVYEEDRLIEQSHGIRGLFNDLRVYFTFYPDQRKLYEQEGAYWHRWLQGECVPDVRNRVRSFMTTMTRDFRNKKMLIVSHHLTLLSYMANLERWNDVEFSRVDKEEKPINCGVTTYTGLPHLGQNGKLMLTDYNRDLSAPNHKEIVNA